MTNINLKKVVFESKGGTNTIHDAEYNEAPCYAIVHVPTGHVEIIDHEDNIVKAIAGRIKRSCAMTCDKKANVHILKFTPTKTEKRITLRYYVYAKYMGLRSDQVRRKKIRLYDESAIQCDILDLRSCNLYDAGKVRPHTAERNIDIVERPGFEGEKYIAISFPARQNGKNEFAEYSPQLYEMLASPKYCEIQYNSKNDRAIVIVHCENKKKGYEWDNLSRFILVYNQYFRRYKNMRGSVNRFIREYKSLSKERHKGQDAAHINSCKWNNCASNLMFMDKTQNNSMRDYIKWFPMQYEVFTTLNDNNEILLEIKSAGVMQEDERVPHHYRFTTPDDYLDWQLVFLGKELTGKLQAVTSSNRDGIREELTPCGLIKAGIVTKETAKENEPGLWTWLEHRDELLAMDKANGNAFFHWKAKAGRTLQGIQIPDIIAVGQPFAAPYGDGYMVVTPLKISNS